VTPIRMRRQWLDALAISASSICLVHCLVLPVLLVMLPALAAFIALPESFHFWALVAGVPMSALAISIGFARHGRWSPVVLATTGLICLAAGELLCHGSPAEAGLAVLGSLQLGLAHALNLRQPRH
jgi:MerC mercury resistance protein